MAHRQWDIVKFFTSGLIALCLFAYTLPAQARDLPQRYPQKANYFLHWTILPSDVAALAKWDLLILDMETQETSREQIRRIRELHPGIILLAYITPQEIYKNADSSPSTLRRKLAARLRDDWYLKNYKGEKLTWWDGTYILNVTNRVARLPSDRFNTFLPTFVKDNILSTGLWDGVFYDNAWDSISFFVGNEIDLNNDGIVEQNPDADWKEGMTVIYEQTKQITGDKYFVVGNGTTRSYRDHLNGNMIENFAPAAWTPTMQTYQYNHAGGRSPRVNILNANVANGVHGGESNYQAMRFGLGSGLMENGFYSFDYGDRDHGQTWWYDEYATDLGKPMGNSLAKNGARDYAPDVWVRSFENGIALVNSTDQHKMVDLGGEYEKIHGVQDTAINNGSIVTETGLASYDGLLLLKTFSSLNDVLYSNGDFVRFFHPDGSRVRNGFFAFEDAYKGGDQLAHVDLNGNQLRDFVVVSKNKISAWRDDGQPFLKIYPFGVSYPGTLELAFGDITGDGQLEIVVAPGPGYALPVQVYTHFGEKLQDNWYPFGKVYKGGYSLGVISGTLTEKGKIVVGSGTGISTVVQLYNSTDYKLFKEWFAYEKYFQGGVHVAVGDVDGDGVEDIVTGSGVGKKPLITVFDLNGGVKNKAFEAYGTIGTPGIDVRVTDVDFDGKKDIVGLSNGL